MMAQQQSDFDVLIVGAGISGIGMAAHLELMCKGRSYGIVEQRDNLGGTWDLFQYPGVRSDSDMHTLGFVFEPWKHERAIADGPSIVEYLNRIVDERDIRQHIRYGHKVISADFRHEDARWHVTVETQNGRQMLTANWLYLGAGYYDYDNPFDAGFDFSQFQGQVIHPQFWPDDLDYEGKNVVVIGSGATAVTIVPSMCDKAAKVTMLQRTPTWMVNRPAKDRIANALRKFLPEKLAYKITRWKNITMQDIVFKKARTDPEKVKQALKRGLEKALGPDYDEAAFTPPYNPWEQRLCLVPDADFFEAMNAGKADIVTGHIDSFTAEGVRLKDGQVLPADIIITATGLSLAIAGKIACSIEGEPIPFHDHFYYKGCMYSNVPNLAVVFGYLNASWTLRADLNSEFVCKVLNVMAKNGAEIATPALSAADEAALEEDDLFDFSSGYIQRGKHIMPKSAVDLPWRLNQDYRKDRVDLRKLPVVDGILQFENSHRNAQREAAE